MAHHTIPTLFFVLVVVQLEQRFLLVQERKHDRKWYLPAGRVKLGESLVEAAKRETLEEAGIPIDLDGILQIDHTPSRDRFTRVRFIFVGHPVDNNPPLKSIPDDESLGAKWVSLEELDSLPLRSYEVRDLIGAVANGSTIYPLSILTVEKM